MDEAAWTFRPGSSFKGRHWHREPHTWQLRTRELNSALKVRTKNRRAVQAVDAENKPDPKLNLETDNERKLWYSELGYNI